MVPGKSFISKKNKRTRILKKISPKTYPLGLGSEIRDPEKIHPGSGIQGVKKHRIPDPGGKKAPDPDQQPLYRL
jgi:hypothetical protein